MRLLQRQSDKGGFSLVERVGTNIPPYAILSHTWGLDEDEVSFKDVKKGRGDDKPGNYKLIFCSKQATRDGLEFFWVDTCCIDKSSSAELSEAINSMYMWYRKAEKCYVYLSDVSTASTITITTQEAWAEIFKRSRWFKRGWTLQELLAPKSVHFFSSDGDMLGDKESLLQALQSTTQIPRLALQCSELSKFSVNERMSWAKGRDTKREEDAAYSLLGIFDIHMPLLYGEGREKAFARLQREIEWSQKALSLDSLSRLWTVPFRRDDDFVNRDSLDEICRICAQPAGRASLVGLGGIGKSQIAIEYAYRVRDQSPSTWVFWVHAGSRARLEDGFRRIAEATKMGGWQDPKADVLRLVSSWLSDESNGQWTMVLDNADDEAVFFGNRSQSCTADMADQQAEPLSNYLPQSANGSILITSRSQAVAHKLTGQFSSVVQVKPMEKDDALILLGKKLGSNVARHEAVELIDVLDCMPLAITQAAAFIRQREPRMNLLRYLDEIRRSDQSRARLLKKDVGDSRRDGQASNSIIATWQISFEHIRKHMPTAARLLSLMSMFDRQGIPESLLQNNYNDEQEDADFDDDIYTLSSFSLVKICAVGNEFEMHQLVQFSTKKWLELYNELEAWKGIYATLMDASYPVGRYENWPLCRSLFPHAQALAKDKPKDVKRLKHWASVLFKAAWYAGGLGQYSKAFELGSAALQVRETVLGAEHPDTLNSLNDIGLALYGQGQYDEAEKMFLKAANVQKRVLGDTNPDTLTSEANLALSYHDQGRWKEAEELGLEVMRTREETLGKDHPDTLMSAANLAQTYSKQERWKEAENLVKEVIQSSRKILGEEHPDTLTSMSNLALMYWSQARLSEAEELGFKVLQTRRTVLGNNHPDTLTSMANLGSTYWAQGRKADAEKLDREVLQARRSVLGNNHPETLNSMVNLCITLEDQGCRVAAIPLMSEYIEISRRVLGSSYPDHAFYSNLLANWQREQATVVDSG